MTELRSFLTTLERAEELLRIKEAVSPEFEASAIMKETDNGPAVIFEKIRGYENPAVAGISGTRDRICKALEIDKNSLYTELMKALQNPVYPKETGDAPVKEIVESPDLTRIPILTHYERDAGPYITSGIVTARAPDGTVENVSFHRMLVLDKDHLAIRVVPRHLHQLINIARSSGEPLQVAIAIGLHPGVSVAAASQPDFGVSEYGVANALMKDKLKLTSCEHVDLRVPSEAELVLEGRIAPNKEANEGPFVDATGTYDIIRRQPVVELVGVMCRKDYIYQALLPAGMEHKLLMGLPLEVKIWQSVRNVVPNVRGVNMTPGGCGWFHAVISVEKQSEGDGKNVLLAAFAAHRSLKHAVVVSQDIDPFDMEEVEWAIATRFRADRDLVVIPRIRGSTLDPSGDQELALTTKVGVDATGTLLQPKEKFERARIPKSAFEKVRGVLDRAFKVNGPA